MAIFDVLFRLTSWVFLIFRVVDVELGILHLIVQRVVQLSRIILPIIGGPLVELLDFVELEYFLMVVISCIRLI